MRIEVNGEPHEIEDDTTLEQLIFQLALAPDRLAVELNREVIRRDLWADTELKDADKIEIVHFVGGGSNLVPTVFKRETKAAK